MEQFDILDKNGNFTGHTANKGTPLLPGQYYLGTHVYIFNSKNEFLLQQRALNKKFLPGGWDIHCEHTMAGETSIECAIRGLKEELGLLVPETNLRFMKRLIREDVNLVDIYFLQTEFEITKLTLPPREVIGAKVISLAEMIVLVENMHYRPSEYREFILSEIVLET